MTQVAIREDVMKKKQTQKSEKDLKLEKIAAKIIRRNYEGLKRLSKN
ncbi:hypothetical protein [Bacillus cereus]|jgi:hypothetical protein|nr:hypothetical protein [Bacillus cereus]